MNHEKMVAKVGTAIEDEEDKYTVPRLKSEKVN